MCIDRNINSEAVCNSLFHRRGVFQDWNDMAAFFWSTGFVRQCSLALINPFTPHDVIARQSKLIVLEYCHNIMEQ